jgi:hypothetical protein
MTLAPMVSINRAPLADWERARVARSRHAALRNRDVSGTYRGVFRRYMNSPANAGFPLDYAYRRAGDREPDRTTA